MESGKFDVLIVGAGMAGLAAAMRLSEKSMRVAVLEARERVGGRVWTVEDEGNAVEMGAEFVHGIPPVIFDLVEKFGLKTTEVDGDQFCNMSGKLSGCDFFEEVNDVLEKLKRYTGPDINFDEFVASVSEKESTREWARNYVAGFHGARPQDAGVKGILLDTKAEEEIDRDRSFRIEGGYRRLVECMVKECERHGVQVRLNTKVERVEWGDEVRVLASGREFKAQRAVITLPLSVLKAGDVRFEPELAAKRGALDGIAMGDVARCVLLFKSRWWEEFKTSEGKSLKDASFLFSRVADFPTWWSQAPSKQPMLVGWASAVTAPGLTGRSTDEVVKKAISALANIVNVDEAKIRSELVAGHWHDWMSDPLSRGAYTYARVGGSEAYKALAAPLGSLHFAGEATDASGNHATVHGAIASGYRAAEEIMASAR